MSTPAPELTDEEIQARLAGESTRGPRFFRDRELAPLTSGLRDVAMKVTLQEDTAYFCDCALLKILGDALPESKEAFLARMKNDRTALPRDAAATRRALLLATDDVPGFRAGISLFIDELNDGEIIEARALCKAILTPVELAEVAIAKKNSPAPKARKPTRTKTPSASGV